MDGWMDGDNEQGMKEWKKCQPARVDLNYKLDSPRYEPMIV